MKPGVVRLRFKIGILRNALEIFADIIYYEGMKERSAINVDQFHDTIRKKHMLCHEHGPPLL